MTALDLIAGELEIQAELVEYAENKLCRLMESGHNGEAVVLEAQRVLEERQIKLEALEELAHVTQLSSEWAL